MANAETGEMEWHAADGSVISQAEWSAQSDDQPAADAAADTDTADTETAESETAEAETADTDSGDAVAAESETQTEAGEGDDRAE